MKDMGFIAVLSFISYITFMPNDSVRLLISYVLTPVAGYDFDQYLLRGCDEWPSKRSTCPLLRGQAA